MFYALMPSAHRSCRSLYIESVRTYAEARGLWRAEVRGHLVQGQIDGGRSWCDLADANVPLMAASSQLHDRFVTSALSGVSFFPIAVHAKTSLVYFGMQVSGRLGESEVWRYLVRGEEAFDVETAQRLTDAWDGADFMLAGDTDMPVVSEKAGAIIRELPRGNEHLLPLDEYFAMTKEWPTTAI